jgi:glycogen phosphorylase
VIEADPTLRDALDVIAAGDFSPDDPSRFHPLLDRIYNTDWFLVAADFQAYFQRQRDVDLDFRDATGWTSRSVLNTANMGWFSSDRTIRGYAKDVWGL